MSDIIQRMSERVLLCDGATGSRVQAADLDVESDFAGQENCSEILNRSRPDFVRDLHRGYLEAGADIVLTNSFGGSPLTLADFDFAEDALELNRLAGELAAEVVAEHAGDGLPRFVLGSIGPGTKLPSLGQVDYDSLEAALSVQAEGLVGGGVDGLLIETVQDPLQLKAAVNGARLAFRRLGREVPIMAQVTIETTGTLLVGTDIAAAATIVHALGLDVFGLNCATGPLEMAEHVRWVSENWPGPISVQPNAGLPELIDGEVCYPLLPEEMGAWLERFVREDGINMVGGCCGTTNDHVRAFDAMLRGLNGGERPVPASRKPEWVPGVASLYGQVGYRQENAYFSIGERCNANGSKKFRELQAAEDWDGCIAMGREQAREGSHALDLCTAFVGRDEVDDMNHVVGRIRGAVDAPLVIDSTELPVLESALKLYAGKALINSINFEDGEAPAAERLRLARRFGAGVIALTIDEEGMAKEADHKVALARRLHEFAVDGHGLAPEDLLFDPLTFTICTGNEDDRKLALETLEAIERIAEELPAVQIILGISNVSFGLKPAARHVLNSVFLDHALRRGLTGAIVHMSKILPLHTIPEEEVRIAEDLIFDRRTDDYDPLHAFIALFQDRTQAKVEKVRAAEVEERLKERIIDGDRQGLEADLDEALQKHPPLDIVNIHLLGGMKVVGDLFGSGQMQLPFVLQSAETMKAAVAHLEPHMERAEGRAKGTIVLATVKGDVHDIGKNLVDIILTNNGYKIVNLGIKQPLSNILEAAREHQADAIGMSGLLVKSTAIMRENLEELARQGVETPILVGGAALTKRYVGQDCREAYHTGRVAYAQDAFAGLHLMEHVVAGSFEQHVAEIQAEDAAKVRFNGKHEAKKLLPPRPVEAEEIRLRREELAAAAAVPPPPFWGPRLVEGMSVGDLLPYLNERMLFQFHWGYRKQGRRLPEYMAWAEKEVKPILIDLVGRCETEDILEPKAVYGYWKAASDGDDLVLFAEDGEAEVGRFQLPRQTRSGGLCIADFVRDVSSGERDVIGLQVVTVGQHASEVARAWFEADRYRDYLYLHGLGVEMAEALAELVHARIRAELGFGHADAREMDKVLNHGYRGARYSFGFPACPNLADQHLLLDLLDAERIGLEMGESDQLYPEQSTSAIVLHHPQARYFSI
ncbi:MAG: methionine synthase [Alphaproteobacteria bacterium]|nr:methionine synthase [Alphaproteobacteria bacterium]